MYKSGNLILHYILTFIDPYTPPYNVRLSEVARNRLDFTWDPVQSVCPDVEYKVAAVNCGVCPSATNDTNISCILNNMDVIYKVCTLSIQTVVCGFTSRNRSENITATLKGVR